MNPLAQFILPFSGYKLGIREIDLKVDDQFFDQFEESPIKKGKVDIKLQLNKRSTFTELIFDFDGFLNVECDRCLGFFDYPISGSTKLMVKIVEEVGQSQNEDCILMDKNTSKLDISKSVYEMLLLAIPISKTHEKAGEKCDESITKYLTTEKTNQQPMRENSPWDILKKLNKN